MADAIVGSLVKSLISLLQTEFSEIKDVKKDVAKLVSTLSTIQAVLEDAEEKQITSKPITYWLRRLKDTSYDAEDVLDAWSLEIQQRALDFANMGCSSKVSHSIPSCFCFKSILFRRRIARKIKEILSNFDEIAKQISDFHLDNSGISQSRSHFSKERETSSIIGPHIYGREENKKEIIDILVTDFVNQENVSVCSIVGMGGLGKTTLAQSIYNDGSVQRHFEKVKIWACVSDPFDLERVLKMILESFEKKPCDLGSLDALSRKVEEILSGKCYLIVLDDVWTEDQDEWNKLKAVLKGGAKGSSILLTTRSPTVASMTSAEKYRYRLEALSDDDCFSLFKNRALGDKGEEEHPNLIAIGKEIANKCKGIPLVAKSLGSCLRFKTDESQWKRIRDSEIWSLDETRENTKILATLRLSYNHLASPLKQCFAYCSLFPKDFRMQRIELIYLWVANGFIKSQEKLELEVVGDEIFNELLRMSFFQDTEEDRCGNISTCKMHDLMHDLASSVSAHECLIAKADATKQVPKTVRHLTLDCELPQAPTNLGHFLSPQPSFRTLCFFGSTDFRNFRFSSTLRVLSLKKTGIETLPSSVCDLKHLRFLDLSRNLLAFLPESFAKLINLQFLDLSQNTNIRTLPLPLCNLEHLRYLNVSYCQINGSLPESIHGLKSLRSLDLSGNGEITEIPDWIGDLEHLRYLNLFWCSRIKSLPESICGLHNLQSLRYIDNYGCDGLRKMPVGIGELKCLQTLPEFVVPSIGGDGAGISELQGLDQLRGRLEIRGLENVRTGADAQTTTLANKKHLRELQLKWSNSSDDSLQVKNSKEVLEGLFPLPPNLQELYIFGYKWEPYFSEELFLENLEYLGFYDCDKIVSLPEGLLEHLTSLKSLKIVRCKGLKRLGIQGGGVNQPNTSSSSHLQSYPLREIYVESCPKLVFSEEDFQQLNALEELYLVFLPRLTVLPQGIQHLTALQSLCITNCHEELHKRYEKDKGEDWHLISHIPDISIHELKCLQTLPVFVVPSIGGDGAGISELQGLDQLRGQLEIRGLENVKTGADAQTAMLANKKYLRELQLKWSNSSDDSLQVKNSKEVLEGLFPLPLNLQKLEIDGYKWEPYFSEELFPQNLESLRFGDCDKIVSLPEGLLEHLTSLKSLNISSCKGLKRLGIQGGGVNHPNTSSSSHLQSYPLREIYISNCPELVFSEEDFQQLNALEVLSLHNLPRLTVLPQGIQHLPMMRRLVIWYCSNLKMLPEWIKHLTALQSLHISNCHEELHKRCEKEKGEDWHLISHIPDLSIFGLNLISQVM